VVHETDGFTRVSGTGGLAGAWRNTKVQATNDSMTIATSAGGGFQISNPRMKETTAGKTDGAPSALKGPDVPPGAAAAYKADGPRKWSYSMTLGGKTYSKGTMSVSADGRTLTQTEWVPGKESEASVSVYARS
jgi:hypothetical protein